MTTDRPNRLSATQLQKLRSALHPGFEEASRAMADWLERPAVVGVDSVDQLDFDEATSLLGGDGQPICFCVAETSGLLKGQMILAFDDTSGFTLTDYLLDQPGGSTTEWDDLARSAMAETTNIICCAFLNVLGKTFSDSEANTEWLPGPPVFGQDFAESILEFAIMDQAIAGNQAVVCETRFMIDGDRIGCTLLIVPDAASMQRLVESIDADNDG